MVSDEQLVKQAAIDIGVADCVRSLKKHVKIIHNVLLKRGYTDAAKMIRDWNEQDLLNFRIKHGF